MYICQIVGDILSTQHKLMLSRMVLSMKLQPNCARAPAFDYQVELKKVTLGSCYVSSESVGYNKRQNKWTP